MARFFGPALHPAKADVGQVLDPFEIAHRHPAGIGIHVRNYDRALAAQDFIRAEGDRAVCRLKDQRRADGGGIPLSSLPTALLPPSTSTLTMVP